MNFDNTRFVRSAAGTEQFIADGRPQVVMAGRSNVGKSSLINALTRQKSLARVSSTPGKTAHVNYYLVDDTLWLVDLPGYGYSRVGESEKKRWAALMEAFFRQQGVITLGLLIVDSRHDPSPLDVQMASYFVDASLNWSVVANKTDKLKPRGLEASVRTLEQAYERKVIPFSAEKKTGRSELIAEILNKIEVP